VLGTGPVMVLRLKVQTKPNHLSVMANLLAAVGWEVESSFAYYYYYYYYYYYLFLTAMKRFTK
jgi:hypothetical protein